MSHYFETPDQARRRHSYEIMVGSSRISIETTTGVFSSRRLDTGTRHLIDLLCEEAESDGAIVDGVIADLGCGAGPLTVAVATLHPASRVLAVDVNDAAREVTNLNAEHNGLTNVTTIRSAGELSEDSRVLELIVSNPPIRVGKEALHRLLLEWLPLMAPHGRALLVVQRHLGADSLAAWLDEVGYEVRRMRSRSGFRLLEVRRRREIVK